MYGNIGIELRCISKFALTHIYIYIYPLNSLCVLRCAIIKFFEFILFFILESLPLGSRYWPMTSWNQNLLFRKKNNKSNDWFYNRIVVHLLFSPASFMCAKFVIWCQNIFTNSTLWFWHSQIKPLISIIT